MTINRLFLIIFALLFAVDLVLVVTGLVQPFDDAVLAAIIGIRTDALTHVFRAVTFCGNTWSVVVLCLLLMILPGRMKIGLPVTLMVVAGFLVQTLFKMLIARPRPDAAFWLVDESTYSFPSGHSNINMIIWIALFVLVGRLLISKNHRTAAFILRIVFAAIAVLIGFSRLYLGVHYPSDVLGGWFLAGTLLIVFFLLYEKIWPAKWRLEKPAGIKPATFT